jgi:hypothetical protein
MADGKSKRGKQEANPGPAKQTDELRYLTRKHWLRLQQDQELMLRAESWVKVSADPSRRLAKS